MGITVYWLLALAIVIALTHSDTGASRASAAKPEPRESLKLVAVQMDVSATSKEERVKRALALVDRAAAAEGHGIYVLPEYALAPMPKDAAAIVAQAEPIPGPITDRFSQIAKQRGVWIAVGMLESSADPKHPYNAIAIVGPAGQTFSYRKTHLWDTEIEPWRENKLFTPGESLGLFDIEGWKIGVMVCADGFFPEVPRTLALRGAKVILYPNARGPIGSEADSVAVTSIVAVVVSNPIGNGGDGERGGTSRIIIPPWGKTVAGPDNKSEGWIAQTFRHKDLVKWREEACSIRDSIRRPELYGPLTERKPSASPAK